MHRRFKALYCIILLLQGSLLADVSFKAEVDRNRGYENTPVTGIIMIGRAADEQVDTASFKLDKNPLQVELVKEESLGPTGDHLLSIYRFTLPAQPKGGHLLPAISASVGGIHQQSIPSTYEILEGIPTPEPKVAAQSSANQPALSAAQTATTQPSLKLQAFVQGPTEIYPGQKITVGYRYTYTGDIDITKEEIPLVKAKGLISIGEQTIKEGQQAQNSILEITQVVQGAHTGTFTYEPSVLEGIPYQLSTSGEKIYSKQKLTTTAEPITIIVKPFPPEGKPASFTGAVGTFKWQSQLISDPQTRVGDPVTIKFSVSGQGNVQAIKLPELCCQPGVSGLFRVSDLPATEQVEGTTKIFNVEMRALSPAITAIPSFEFSSFDGDTQSYVRTTTEPIPITVVAAAEETQPAQQPKEKTEPENWKENLGKVDAIEIDGYTALENKDLRDKFFGTWWSLLCIPFGIGFLMFQSNLKNYFAETRLEIKPLDSSKIFDSAEKASPGSFEQFDLWEKAFLMRLFEAGIIDKRVTSLESLPTDGLAGKVREFLLQIQKEKYAGESVYRDKTQQIKAARALFEQIKSGQV